MSNQTIKLKRSSQPDSTGVPNENQLELGEVAINTYHGKMYIKRSDGASPTPNESIVELGKVQNDTDPYLGGNLNLNTRQIRGTGSIDVNGRIFAANGDVDDPAFAFTYENDTGMFRPTTGTLALTRQGTEIMRLSTANRMLVRTTSNGNYGATLRTGGRIEGSSLVATGNGSQFLWGGYYGGPAMYVKSYYNSSNTTNAAALMHFTSSNNATRGTLSLKGSHLLLGISSGNLLVGGTTAHTPTAKLDVDGNTIRLRSHRTIAASNSAGNRGDICYDSSYLYICTSTNTWKRIALAW